MNRLHTSKGLAVSLLTLALTACGGGSSNSSAQTPVTGTTPTNVAPEIPDISDLTVMERAELTITANATDSDGTIASYAWEQVSGTTLTITGLETASIQFTAPDIDTSENIVLRLTVTDDKAATTSKDFSVSLEAYEAISEEKISDQALLSCALSTNMDMGSDSLTCINSPVSTLDDLNKFTNLKSVHLEGTQISDIAPLANISSLQNLTLINNPIDDITVVEQLESLTTLSIVQGAYGFENQTISLDKFSNLTQLTFNAEQHYYHSRLHIKFNTLPNTLTHLNYVKGRDFDEAHLSTLTNLTHLKLDSVSVNEAHIKPLINLESLALRKISNFQSLSFLTVMPAMKELSFENISAADSTALSLLTNLTSLSLVNHNFTDLTFISAMTDLEKLVLQGGYSSSDFDTALLSDLTELTELVITNYALVSPENLANLTQMTSLILNNTDLNSVSFVKSMPELLKFDVRNNSELNDIDWLEFTPKIEYLNVERIGSISNLSVISQLPNLSELALSASSYYSTHLDATILQNSSQLKKLKAETSTIENIEVIEKIVALEELNLNLNTLDTLPSLGALPNLKNVSIRTDSSELTDISQLSQNARLESLELSGFSNVTDITVLSGYSNLKALKLTSFEVSDIAPLTQLTGLTSLSLRYFDELLSAKALSSLTNLNTLDLEHSYNILCADLEFLKNTFADINYKQSYNCIEQPINFELITDPAIAECLKDVRDAAKVTQIRTCGSSAIESLAGIEQFSNLTSLSFRYLNSGEILNRPVLAQLAHLNNIELYNSTLTHLEGVTLPGHVKSLSIRSTQKFSISTFIAPSLTSLNLEYINLLDPAKLSSFPGLTHLNLEHTDIRDLSALPTLSKLERLSLSYNSNLPCADIDALKAARPNLYLRLWNTNCG
ncbi:PKD domain-containing protein [Pseudoalteromonas aurantia]|uniref:Uncharacterized protein n=1 Tax=Pseudoalteromonas aurantia TaxID=43654 RepID=A0A5S3VAN1_9GAMM|nr:leucine-rich repeat domain-containing protein [Pseudoalteromonas aurantia]TMO64162.1 hypothetical protein CWC18_06955 [Pseudoalteromonas aurantia]TMO68558.1 hypothetical protein CWC19_09095 [Pseudoalteromonas aurantia]TMO75151.1 hypothetical protein CWC20_08475 [Pseudoalteromonas aurantia]